MYRRRWILAIALAAVAAVAWGVLVARETNGWGQLGMWILLSGVPGILTGLLGGPAIVCAGYARTHKDLRHVFFAAGWRLAVDAVLLGLGTFVLTTAACYLSGFIAMALFPKGGC